MLDSILTRSANIRIPFYDRIMRSGLDCSLHPVDSSRRFATERIHEIHICASRHLAITSACTSTRYARITSPVCPSEYCGRQAINGISGNERRTKTRPETRFDCQMPNVVWQLSNKIEVDSGKHFNLIKFPTLRILTSVT